MEQIVVVIDDTGSALGSVQMNEGNFVLLDKSGKVIQKINSKMTVKQIKEILLRRRLEYII